MDKAAYQKEHGEEVSREDYDAYVVRSKKRGKLKRPLSFKDYKDLAGFYGKKSTEKESSSVIWKGGADWHGKYKKGYKEGGHVEVEWGRKKLDRKTERLIQGTEFQVRGRYFNDNDGKGTF